MITYSQGLGGSWTFFGGRDVLIPVNYSGSGLLYAGNASANERVVIQAPIASVSLQNLYSTSYFDLVIDFENGSRVLFNQVLWNDANLTRAPGFVERIDIDLMPAYGINETVSIDFTQPGAWQTFNGTNGDDFFDDIIRSRTGKEPWDLDINTIQLGGLGSDDLFGESRGTDVLFGGLGHDFLESGKGRNLLYGGPGDDLISLNNYGQSDYLVSGGSGNDTYLVTFGPQSLVDSDSFFTGNIRQDGSEIWERRFDVSTKLTPIYDHSGNDRLLIQNEFLSWDSGAGVWQRGDQLLNSDTWTRFEVVGNNLQIATTLTQSSIDGNLDLFFGRQADWWFRSVGFESPWEPGEYKWGMTEQEKVLFNPKDPTTYPGWSELGTAAQQWLSPRLDPAYWEVNTIIWDDNKRATYFDFVQRLSWRVNEVTNRNGDDRSNPIRKTPRIEGGINLLEQAKDNVAFDESNFRTWPYFEFSQNLEYSFDPNMAGLPSLQDVQSGIEILGFASGTNLIETVLVEQPNAIKSFLLDPANKNNIDPIGAEFDRLINSGFSISEAVNGALSYARAQGFFREFKTSHTGIAQNDQDHLLVANQVLANTLGVSDLMTNAGFGFTTVDAGETVVVQGRSGNDTLYSKTSGKTAMLGGEGDNWFELQGGQIWALGGAGEDTFVIRDHGNMLHANIIGGDGANDDRIFVDQHFNDVAIEFFAAGQSGQIRLDNGSVIDFRGIESIQFIDWLIADTSNPVFPAPPYELIEIFGDDSFFFGSNGAEKVISRGGQRQEIYTLGGNDWVIFEGDAGTGLNNRTLIDTGAGDDIIDLTAMTGQVDLITGTGNDVIKVSSRIVSTSYQDHLSTINPSQSMSGVLVFDLENGSRINYSWEMDPQIRGNDSIVFVDANGAESLLMDLGESLVIGTNGPDTTTLTSASTFLAFDGNDTVWGSSGDDVIDTGNGDDVIYLSLGRDTLIGGAGNDVYVINGPATAIGKSKIVEQSGGGFDVIQISQDFYGGSPNSPFNYSFKPVTYIDSAGDLVIGALRPGQNGAMTEVGVKIEGFTSRDTVEAIDFWGMQFLLDRDGDARGSAANHYLVADKSSATTDFKDVWLFGGSGDDILVGNMAITPQAGLNHFEHENYVRNILNGGDGNDRIHGLSGWNILIGGSGNDTFIVGDYEQNTYIVGDFVDNNFWTNFYLGGFNTQNEKGSWDIVQIGWSRDESIFEETANGTRIYRKDEFGQKKLNQYVDIYDIEEVQFWDGTAFEKIQLTKPEVVELFHLNYSTQVQFRFGDSLGNNPDIIELWDKNNPNQFFGSYNRKQVAEFQFLDQVVKVVQQLGSGLSDQDPGALIYDGRGVDAVQIIYGTKHNDVIIGGKKSDFIFGGDGDDVLIGHMGNNVILGGKGNDYIRGGLLDKDVDAGDTTYTMNASDFLSGSNDTLIIGGDGVDDIRSGTGRNFVASGRVEDSATGDVNLQLIHNRWGQTLFNDDEWI